jgi:hypothetical protein
MGLIIRPDCADLPYFLRAYFAFKMGLPFGYSKCSRGDGGEAPKCPEWWNIQNPEPPRPSPAEQQKIASQGPFSMLGQPVALPVSPPKPPPPPGLAPAFGRYLPILADGVHSGSGRTALRDDHTDYYPVPLTEKELRPGTKLSGLRCLTIIGTEGVISFPSGLGSRAA